VLDTIGPELLGMEATEQRLVDQALLDLDGTPDKSRLGANALLGVSLAVAKAAAETSHLPLFRYVGGPNAHLLPVPMLNILNGGLARRHQRRRPGVHGRADRRADLLRGAALGRRGLPRAQERAEGPRPGHRRRRRGRLRARPAEQPRRARPDHGGHRATGLTPGRDIGLALDVAATEFHSDGGYAFEGGTKSADEMTRTTSSWSPSYPMVSIEDPLDEADWDGWERLTAVLGARVQIVGDDLFVTNPQRLADGINRGCGNALLVKVNQIGTLTETLDAVDLAHRSGYRSMMSHRSGETEDTTIADLAVATNCGQIKSGAPARSSAWPSTTSCCASRRSSTTPRATPAPPPSRASGRPTAPSSP
jgi:enolase